MYKLINTYEDKEETVKMTFGDEITANDFVAKVEQFMLACGYHPNTVSDALNKDTSDSLIRQ